MSIGERLFGHLFWLGQRVGMTIMPNHFYSPVPDFRNLTDFTWTRRSDLVGVDINEEVQLELLSDFVSRFKDEYDQFPPQKPSDTKQYFINNAVFESVDGEILYSMIRRFRPKNIIEIGSGHSTILSSQAIGVNKAESKGYECAFTAIEPYPSELVKQGLPHLTELVVSDVQEIPLDRFLALEENDILFIDSSHVLKIGSDVQYEFLEVLPRLKKGTLIHVHDIFLPAEYPRQWAMNRSIFSEQYLLQALLLYSSAFKVLWAGSYMHLNHPQVLSDAFSSYDETKCWPGSFWMRKII